MSTCRKRRETRGGRAHARPSGLFVCVCVTQIEHAVLRVTRDPAPLSSAEG